MDLIGDEQGRLERLAGWLRATPAEALGLVVLLTGSLVASVVLVWSTVTGGPTVRPDSSPVAGEAPDAGGGAPDAAGVGTDAADPGAGPPGDTHPHADAPTTDVAAGDVAPPPAGPSGGDTPAPTDVDAPAGEVTVHVAGAVTSPGVVSLPAGARVADAVEAAGGAVDAADLARTNLARVLADGEHLVVLREGEEAPPPDPGAAGGATTPPTGGALTDGGLVDVNTASAAELEVLPGIGPGLSTRIVEHRERHGPFAEPGDLRDVSGIGEVRFQELAERVTTG